MSEGMWHERTRPAVVGFEDGMQPQIKECGQPLETEEARKWVPPSSLQKEHSCADTLILAQ